MATDFALIREAACNLRQRVAGVRVLKARDDIDPKLLTTAWAITMEKEQAWLDHEWRWGLDRAIDMGGPTAAWSIEQHADYVVRSFYVAMIAEWMRGQGWISREVRGTMRFAMDVELVLKPEEAE